MIGAMPAVAVRHDRRRQEKRGGRRPSQLTIQMGRSANSASSTPSPPEDRHNSRYYICVRMSALHIVVGSLLLGIVVMVVGLVQLSPGAEAAQHRFYLIGAGIALIVFGVGGAFVRCVCLHLHNKMLREQQAEAHAAHSAIKSNAAATAAGPRNGVKAVNEKGKAVERTSVTSPISVEVRS